MNALSTRFEVEVKQKGFVWRHSFADGGAPQQQLEKGEATTDTGTAITFWPDGSIFQETVEFDSAWGVQHAGVLENFAANILDGTPLLAPGSEGINGVRLANAIHLSGWTGREVSLQPFDEDAYLTELNRRIAAEGAFGVREEA